MPDFNLLLISIGVMVVLLLPISLAIMVRRSWPVPWLNFCVGILTFIGAQLIHFPLNWVLEELGLLPDLAEPGTNLLVAALILGLTAALTEELARTAGYAVMKKARGFPDGIMLGLGHGGIESMLLGIMIAAGAASLLMLIETGQPPTDLLPQQVAVLDRQMNVIVGNPIYALTPMTERLIALLAQVSLSIIVLQAFVRRNVLFIIAAIVAHMILDAVAVYVGNQLDNVWSAMGIIGVIAILLALWAWSLRKAGKEVTSRRTSPVTGDRVLFIVNLKKELKFHWRSRRAIIVWAVFLVFGMGSPLIAKYTPELFKSFEETRQFADLIPAPTAEDAVTQYIKNLSQFGFVLVILLGMNAVAGEKERGTAAMILSKPLPRSTFVISKFVAQSIIYFIAFVLAAVAAYYYAVILFPGIAFWGFFGASGILFSWLLVFVAITLMGSVIGKTTPAAAGFALVGAVVVLLVGSIPQYGALAPGGLLAWANFTALGEAGWSNFGALVSCLVVIILALVISVATLEQQEI